MSAASVRIDDLGHRCGDRVALDALSLSAFGGVAAFIAAADYGLEVLAWMLPALAVVAGIVVVLRREVFEVAGVGA